MTAETAQSPSRTALIARASLAGPVALAVAALVMLGMPLWVPAGAGNIDNLVLPLVVVPLIWAVLFFHALIDPKLWRVAAVAVGLAVGHAAVLAARFAGAS